MTKYAELVPSDDFSFMPVAIETLGAWGPSALALYSDIDGQLASESEDPRSRGEI